MKPFHEMRDQGKGMVELVIKIVPLIASSIWTAFNLRDEKNKVQFQKNARIEMFYLFLPQLYFISSFSSGFILLSSVVSSGGVNIFVSQNIGYQINIFSGFV